MYSGPVAPDGKCPRCQRGADPVGVIAWVGFPKDQPRPDYDIAYDGATKLPGYHYVAIYGTRGAADTRRAEDKPAEHS